MPEFVRVQDKDTGHIRSVHPEEVPHGNYAVLDEPAVDPITGDVLPPVLAKPSGKASTPKKEN